MDIRASKALVGIQEFLDSLAKAGSQALRGFRVTLESKDSQGIVESREFRVSLASRDIPVLRVHQAIQGLAELADSQEFQVTVELKGYLATLASQHLGTLAFQVLQDTQALVESVDIQVSAESRATQELKVNLVIRELKV